jgi:hypothetical protein
MNLPTKICTEEEHQSPNELYYMGLRWVTRIWGGLGWCQFVWFRPDLKWSEFEAVWDDFFNFSIQTHSKPDRIRTDFVSMRVGLESEPIDFFYFIFEFTRLFISFLDL